MLPAIVASALDGRRHLPGDFFPRLRELEEEDQSDSPEKIKAGMALLRLAMIQRQEEPK